MKLSPTEQKAREMRKLLASYGRAMVKPKKEPVTLSERLAAIGKPSEQKIQVIEKKVYMGKPGEKGEKGDRGESVRGSDGRNGKDGQNGRDGRDGKDGKTPVKGVDFFTAEEIAALKKEIMTEFPEHKDFSITPEFVKEVIRHMKQLPETDRLEIQDIRNAQQFIFSGTKYKTSELMHGGGSSSGGGSTLTAETPSGAVDDSNVTFTVVNEPLYINVNGSQYTVGNGLYSSYVAGTITLSSPVGSGGFITSFFNA